MLIIQSFAEDLAKAATASGMSAEVVDLLTFDPESHILPEVRSKVDKQLYKMGLG